MNTHLENTVMKEAMYDIEARKLVIKKLRPKHFYNSDNKELFIFLQQEWIDDINQTLEVLIPKVIANGLVNIFLDTEQFPASGDVKKNIDYIIKAHLEHEFNIAMEMGDENAVIRIVEERKKLFKEELSDQAFYNNKDIDTQIKDAIHNGLDLNLFNTGIHGLDDYYKIIKKQTTIITGVPSAGKSNFVDDIAVNLAKEYDWKILYFSPENQPIALHLMNIARKYEQEQMMATKKDMDTTFIKNHFTFINTNIVPHSLENIFSIARKVKPDLLVIDPWNEITVEGDNEHQFIGESLSKIKSFSYLHDIHVFIVAHPTKLRKDEKGDYKGQYPPATAYDINGSAMWYNKADNILSLWRGIGNENELHIQKIKFENVTGKRGKLDLLYHTETGCYSGI